MGTSDVAFKDSAVIILSNNDKMNVILTFLVIISSVLHENAALSDKRRCIDEKCSVPISQGRVRMNYPADEEGKLSVKAGGIVTIYSKEAGSDESLWGISYNGKRGYIPKDRVKEEKVYRNGKAELLVDTEVPNLSSTVISSSETNEDSPHMEVFDGTTLYNAIAPSTTTKKPMLNTQVPRLPKGNPVPIENEPLVNAVEENKSPGSIDPKDDKDSEDDDDNEDDDDEDLEDNDGKPLNEEKSQNNEATNDLSAENNLPAQEVDKEVESVAKKSDGNNFSKSSVDSEKINTETVDFDNVLPESADKPSDFNINGSLTDNDNKSLETDVNDLKSDEKTPENIKTVENDETFANSSQMPSEETENEVLNTQESKNENVNDTKDLKMDSVKNDVKNTIKIEDKSKNIEESNSEAKNEDPRLKQYNVFPNFHPMKSANDLPKQQSEVLPVNSSDFPVGENLPLENLTDGNQISIEQNSTPENIAQKTEQITNITKEKPVEPVEIVDDEVLRKNQSFHTEVSTESTPEKITESVENVDDSKPEIVEETSIKSSTGELKDETIIERPKEETITEKYEEEKITEKPEGETITENPEEITITETNEEEIITEEPKEEIVESVKIESESSEDLNEEAWFTTITRFFSFTSVEEEPTIQPVESVEPVETHYHETYDDILLSKKRSSCDANSGQCPLAEKHLMLDTVESSSNRLFDFASISDGIFATAIAAVSVVLFLLGFLLIEKMRRERPLIAKINHLEKDLLVLIQENQQLSDNVADSNNLRKHSHFAEQQTNESIVLLQRQLHESDEIRANLEAKIQSLSKELESSDELACEMNKVVTELLASQEGIDNAMSNIDELQNQVSEQQSVINSINSQLAEKDNENEELKADLDIHGKKINDLSAELEKVMLNLIKVEEEKNNVTGKHKKEITELSDKLSKLKSTSKSEINKYSKELSEVKSNLAEAERKYNLKCKEYNLLKDTLSAPDSNRLLDFNSMKAEVLQLQQDNKTLKERSHQDLVIIKNFETQTEYTRDELETLKRRYEEADKEKLHLLTKLEVLGTYFKDKEAELQRQLNKQESLWVEKQGEATSITEKIKFLQEEIQNYKSQVATLQQEIVQQEVDLKSQISVLEKKSHENWVAARQAERKVEDARQEAAQLRNRLTLRERSLIEKTQPQNSLPMESNGELPPPPHLHPIHPAGVDSPASPSIMYGARDHLRGSPSSSMPPFPPPPPPGAPFLPPLPPLPFLPPPLLPGDQRPPPLGRMSSPPINPPFSPDSRYSPYDANTPSPTDDEYYRPIRSYSPYRQNDRRDRDFRSPPVDRTNSRNNKSGTLSSGSANSNESLERINNQSRYHSKV